MIKYLQNIWKDPVWSKVISYGIIGILSKQIFQEFLNIEISLKYILLIVILAVISKVLFNKFQKNKTITYNEDNKNLDKTLFLKIRNEIISKDNIDFIREFNFSGNAFMKDSINSFLRYEYYCNDPEFEFIDSELNLILLELTHQIKRFGFF